MYLLFTLLVAGCCLSFPSCTRLLPNPGCSSNLCVLHHLPSPNQPSLFLILQPLVLVNIKYFGFTQSFLKCSLYINGLCRVRFRKTALHECSFSSAEFGGYWHNFTMLPGLRITALRQMQRSVSHHCTYDPCWLANRRWMRARYRCRNRLARVFRVSADCCCAVRSESSPRPS